MGSKRTSTCPQFRQAVVIFTFAHPLWGHQRTKGLVGDVECHDDAVVMSDEVQAPVAEHSTLSFVPPADAGRGWSRGRGPPIRGLAESEGDGVL
jgi:hypothetical protein